MLTRVAIVACIALMCVAAVQAAPQRAPKATGPALPHPELTASPETKANWARIRKELEARNYTRPTTTLRSNLSAPYDGVYGVDISSWIGETTWTCILQAGYSFAIAREYQENCQVDPNGVHTVANAWAAGLAHVDVYLFPSYGCGTSAAEQVDAVISSMGSIPFGTIWIDVEDGGQGAPQDNMNWVMAALAEGNAKLGGGRMGIYSSQYEWGQVMGSLGGPTNYPLWYADYDGVPNFSGFNGFAGWYNPAMKQFAGDASLCGADVDLNWYPA